MGLDQNCPHRREKWSQEGGPNLAHFVKSSEKCGRRPSRRRSSTLDEGYWRLCFLGCIWHRTTFLPLFSPFLKILQNRWLSHQSEELVRLSLPVLFLWISLPFPAHLLLIKWSGATDWHESLFLSALTYSTPPRSSEGLRVGEVASDAKSAFVKKSKTCSNVETLEPFETTTTKKSRGNRKKESFSSPPPAPPFPGRIQDQVPARVISF